MGPEGFAATVAVVTFGGGLIGLALQQFLPDEHTAGPARDMIGAVVGLLTLLCALVAGLLIWTAYGVYAGQNAAIQNLAAKVVQLNLARGLWAGCEPGALSLAGSPSKNDRPGLGRKGDRRQLRGE